ncbi:nuclear transport factor 2 family protein [Nonomuraea sp. K274]|uniref:Nuclear transport factor 2 family protein n=1 Tax=Nonomuraea cypriaca TaxID=1187855 RepID=A0A931AFV7_9ACTN|nr:nuclear transport factor 2 family protein [Nonomuraea cypriaca]MBF8189479.1 nuclear transport factor 2 family protein [Nonomuraea cypriaca]
MTHHDTPQPRVILAGDPDSPAAQFVAAMNSGDPDALDHAYEDGAVLVPVPGHPVTGTARLAANQHMQSFGLPIEASPRHVYVADDIALLIVDWSMRGTAPDGTAVDLSGTATDVARRGADGRWRYVIDNPHGTA